MKVRVTFDIDDTDRIAISVAAGTGFANANRGQMEDFIRNAVNDKMEGLNRRFKLATDQILAADTIGETDE
jgi:hypothetical protein